MTQTTVISNSAAVPVHSSFVQYLRRKADEHERVAPNYEGSALYPPSWWLAAAAADRQMAAEIERIEQVAS